MTVTPERCSAFEAINSERDYQDSRFAVREDIGRSREATDRTLDEFILYILQYAAEASALTTHGAETDALDHVRKVAALCVGCMERHGAPRREGF